MITKHYKLDPVQLRDLDKLCHSCQKKDGNIVPTYPHLLSQMRSLPSTLLFYSKKKLAGFLSVFFFYNDACEISLMIAPSFRKQGLATLMLKEMLPFTMDPEIKTLVFSIPHHLNHDNLIEHHFTYQHSEFQMQRISKKPLLFDKENITVRQAFIEDIPALNSIDGACFNSSSKDMEARFKELLHHRDYQLYIAHKNGKPIGKAHIYFEQNTARFSDIAILPSLQGQGLGSALLAHCINTCLNRNIRHLSLDVETTNQTALSLYTRLGFDIINAYDFWSIPKINLQQIIGC